MAREIFKLQRPLMTTADVNTLLAYNKDRSQTLEVKMTPDVIVSLFGDEYKIYCMCGMKGDQFEIGDKVEWQEW